MADANSSANNGVNVEALIRSPPDGEARRDGGRCRLAIRPCARPHRHLQFTFGIAVWQFQPPQGTQFVPEDPVRGRSAFRDPTDVQGGRSEVHLIPAKGERRRNLLLLRALTNTPSLLCAYHE